MLEELKKLIRMAGSAVAEYYAAGVSVQYKEDHSPVTEADMASHKILVEGLSPFGFPILSEEGGDPSLRFTSEYIWLVDPLDGTKDFLEKTGEFSVMIGLIQSGKPILGLVYQPISDTLFYAEKGRGAWREEKIGNPVPLHVSPKISDLTLWVSRHHHRLRDNTLAASLGIKKIVACGSIGFKASLIASGQGEIYINSGNQSGEWDTCASEITITEAGGKLTDIEGKPIEYNKRLPRNPKGVVITNWKLHDKVIEKLRNI